MRHSFKSMNTLFIRGILFLIPLVVLILVIEKGYALIGTILGPFIRYFEGKHLFGIGLQIIVSVAILFIIILLAGLISRMEVARQQMSKVEDAVLKKLPGYSLLKSMIDNVDRIEEGDSLKVVIAEVDDGWKFGFVSEELEDGKSAVFLPDAPYPWSGSLVYLAPEQITKTDIPIKSAMRCLSTFGNGSNEVLKEYFPGVPKRAMDNEGTP